MGKKEFGILLKKCRLDNDLSIAQLTEELDIVLDHKFSVGTISKWEHGTLTPREDYVEALAKVLDVDKAIFLEAAGFLLTPDLNKPINNHMISLVAKNEQIPNNTKHDEKVFMASDAIMNELTLMDFLDTLDREHAYSVSTCKIDAFVRFFYLLSNKYLSPTLAQSVLSLQSDLTKLFRFLVNHFFSYPDTQNETDLRLALRPELLEAIHDGDAEAEKKYNKFSQELETLIDAVKRTYSNYRKAIKDNLAV